METGKEYYHTREEFDSHGVAPFLQHAERDLVGKRNIPLAISESHDGYDPVIFTFSTNLLRESIKDTSLLEKSYEVAIKYGLRGHSEGGKNGIVYQRKGDTNMLQQTSKLIEESREEISNLLKVSEDQIEKLPKVKIVHHASNGKRIVGVHNEDINWMLFLGYAHY